MAELGSSPLMRWGPFLKVENSPLCGEFQKGEAFKYVEKEFFCEITSCLDSKSIHKGTQ